MLDDQVWFVLDDLRRLMGHPNAERLANRLEDDQVCTRGLHLEDGEQIERLLVSESGAYAALILFNGADQCGIRRWISSEVIPTVRSHVCECAPRHLHIRWDRHALRVLDWQGQFWVSLAELPRETRDMPVRSGWRGFARCVR